MRTTLTLDDDVARLLERARKRRGITLKALVNEALREGLARLEAPRSARKRHATKAVSLGRCLLGTRRWPRGDRTPDQHDAYCVADALRDADRDGLLGEWFEPKLTRAERRLAGFEGWILGVP